MENKRGRGRPKVSEKLAPYSSAQYENILVGSKRFRSRRSITDTVYAYAAMEILLEAASDIEDLELILDEGTHYMCRSILNQLGRMRLIENYDKDSIIKMAKVSAYRKKHGWSVKEIESYIRHGRLTGEW